MKPYALTALFPTGDSFEEDRTGTITICAGDDDKQPPFIQIDGYLSFDTPLEMTNELNNIVGTMLESWEQMGGTT